MTVPAVHCEVRKIAYRQTKEGLVVSFVIHPDEMPSALATAPLGQRYMLALAAIGDDEQPIAPIAQPICNLEAAGSIPAGRSTSSERGRLAYANGTPGEKARIRAAMLPDDYRFRLWLLADATDTPANHAEAERYIRDRCCQGDSRSLIATNPEYLKRFLAFETEYLIETNQMAEPR